MADADKVRCSTQTHVCGPFDAGFPRFTIYMNATDSEEQIQ